MAADGAVLQTASGSLAIRRLTERADRVISRGGAEPLRTEARRVSQAFSAAPRLRVRCSLPFSSFGSGLQRSVPTTPAGTAHDSSRQFTGVLAVFQYLHA